MPDPNERHIAGEAYQVVEVVGTSTESISDGARNAVNKAAGTLNNLTWAEVDRTLAHLEDGKIVHFQVAMKIGYRLD